MEIPLWFLLPNGWRLAYPFPFKFNGLTIFFCCIIFSKRSEVKALFYLYFFVIVATIFFYSFVFIFIHSLLEDCSKFNFCCCCFYCLYVLGILLLMLLLVLYEHNCYLRFFFFWWPLERQLLLLQFISVELSFSYFCLLIFLWFTIISLFTVSPFILLLLYCIIL